jgi:hypothetical protein
MGLALAIEAQDRGLVWLAHQLQLAAAGNPRQNAFGAHGGSRA